MTIAGPMPHPSEPIVMIALVVVIVVTLAFMFFLTPIGNLYYGVKNWIARSKRPGGRVVPKKK